MESHHHSATTERGRRELREGGQTERWGREGREIDRQTDRKGGRSEGETERERGGGGVGGGGREGGQRESVRGRE